MIKNIIYPENSEDGPHFQFSHKPENSKEKNTRQIIRQCCLVYKCVFAPGQTHTYVNQTPKNHD